MGEEEILGMGGVIKKSIGVMLLIGLLAVFPFLFIFLAAMGSEGSTWSSAQDLSAEPDGELYGVDYDEFWYDPQNVLDNLPKLYEAADADMEGHSYLTDSDWKQILKANISYRKLVRKDIGVGYTYYKHHYSWSENPDYTEEETVEGNDVQGEGGMGTKEKYIVSDMESENELGSTSNSSIEDDPIFSVSWEEIYAFSAMKSVIDEGEEKSWEDELVDTGKRRKKSVAKNRIDADLIVSIINAFSFEFGYYFDPTTTPGQIYEFKDMENYAYVPVKSGVNVEHGTEVAGETPPFTYTEKKIPAVAPSDAKNCYQTVEYVYEGRVLKNRVVTIDGDAFFAFAESIVGSGNFDFEWFMDKLRILPGADYDPGGGQGSLMDRYERIYESWQTGAPVVYVDGGIPGAGAVTLGENCSTSTVAHEQITVSNNGGNISAGATITYKPSWTADHKAFIEAVGEAAVALWEKWGILPSVTIAQAILESSWGGSGLSANYGNFFGIKENGVKSDASPWDGTVCIMRTREEGPNGTYYVEARFRAYKSMQESIEDHAIFLNVNKRYSDIIGKTDYRYVCDGLQKAGYATSSRYASSLKGLIEAYGLDVYDKKAIYNPNWGRD